MQHLNKTELFQKDKEQLDHSILEAALDAIVTITSDGLIVEWNRAATEIFGYTREEAIGQEMAELIIPSKYHAAHRSGLARYLATGNATVLGRRLELSAIGKAKNEFPIELAIATLTVNDRRYFTARIRDISERLAKEEKLRVVVQEMHHRVKNTMAVILSIARQTSFSSKDVPTFFSDFEARLLSLAATHNLLAQTKWSPVTIEELFAQELKPYEGVTISGPTVEIAPRPALTLGMCIHEMMTNSAKYGSLSAKAGTINVHWTVNETHLEVYWIERNGPALSGPPTHKGFGSKMMRAGFFTELSGQGKMDFSPEGLNGYISIPLEKLK